MLPVLYPVKFVITCLLEEPLELSRETLLPFVPFVGLQYDFGVTQSECLEINWRDKEQRFDVYLDDIHGSFYDIMLDTKDWE